MPVLDSDALILRSFPLGEADRIISFLSRSHGRLRGVAKGARRTKSRFGSTLELLTHVHLWFYERETRDLVRITQSELIASFFDLQSDFDTSVAASLLAEISEAVLPEKEPSDPAFRLLLVTAGAMKQSRRAPVPLAYFTLWTLRLAGWLPSLERCTKCGKALGAAATAFGSTISPGLLCATCKRGITRSLAAPERTLIRRILTEKLDTLSTDASLDPAASNVAAWALDVVELQIEKKLKSRTLMDVKA